MNAPASLPAGVPVDEPAFTATQMDVSAIVNACRAIEELVGIPARRLSRDEMIGELLEIRVILRNVLLWRLPPKVFAALDL